MESYFLVDINMKSKFVISIVSHGHGSLLSLLLDDLHKFVPTVDVVVTFNIPEVFEAALWPRVKFIYNTIPRGFGANHNAALSTSGHEWLVIINPDIRLSANTFPEISLAIRDYPAVDLFAPQVIGTNGALEDSARTLPTPFRVLKRASARLLGREPKVDSAELKSWFGGMFLVVRHSAFRLAGGFDEKFFLYGEDVALCIQLVAKNRRIQFVSKAVVVHDARRATLRSLRHLRWHLASLFRLWTTPNFYLHERRYVALENERTFNAHETQE